MAEITSGDSRKKQHAGVAKAKRLSTRVDLTPMVDLGFLLITFFIFTTSMSKPTVMRLVMPDDKGDLTPTKESGALTLLPAGGDKVYYYEGKFEENNLKQADINTIRDVIIDKKLRTSPKDFVVVLRPTNDAVYSNIVDILDEMVINDVHKYAFVDITAVEESQIKQ